MIARAPDFYGPATPTGVTDVLVFDAWRKIKKRPGGERLRCPFADLHARRRPRSAHARRVGFGVGPEPGICPQRLILLLGVSSSLWPRGRCIAPRIPDALAAHGPNVWVVKPVVWRTLRMLYQNDAPYVFTRRSMRELLFVGTPYAEGVPETAASYQSAEGRV